MSPLWIGCFPTSPDWKAATSERAPVSVQRSPLCIRQTGGKEQHLGQTSLPSFLVHSIADGKCCTLNEAFQLCCSSPCGVILVSIQSELGVVVTLLDANKEVTCIGGLQLFLGLTSEDLTFAACHLCLAKPCQSLHLALHNTLHFNY